MSLQNFSFDVNCPKCKKTLTASSKDVGKTITCNYCHTKISLADKGFSQGINKANKSIDKIKKQFK